MSEQMNSPIELLQALEKHSLNVSAGLPQQEEIRNTWSGICFRVGELSLVAPLDQVSEIMPYPKMTLVPGTQGWVKGIANVRGTLLAVTDLNQFLGNSPTPVANKSRILVYRRDELAVGLLVNSVLGLKHFTEDEKVTAVSKFDESIRDYVHGAFKQDGEESLVFSMHTLIEDPDFFRVAV